MDHPGPDSDSRLPHHLFYAIFSLSHPADWIGPGFFLLAHLSFWIWVAVQPAYKHRYTCIRSVFLSCLIHISLEVILGILLPLLFASLQLTLVIHIVLFLLTFAVCFAVYSSNLMDSRN